MSQPTQYKILYDSIGETLSKIEMLTFKLCHLYFNIPGPIRVPAPILYAHKLCYLIAEKNELELENGPEREPIRIHDSFNASGGSGPSLYFI